jgi:probable rRNA maturation factor
MVVHGTLHAVGYDHELKIEAQKMEAIEIEVLSRFGIYDPYQGPL